MPDKVLISFLVADAIFAASGGLLLAIVFITRARTDRARTVDNVASDLLLMNTPLDGALFNAGLVFFAFLVSLPGLILPSNRIWFTVHGWLVTLCGITTLVLGLDIWFLTLKTRSNVGDIWRRQSDTDVSLIQSKFNCCGYLDGSTLFKPDLTCPTAAIAAQKIGCVGPFSNYANNFLDIVFTSMFGFVALDVILFLCTAMILKRRDEQERYRHIDEKNEFNAI